MSPKHITQRDTGEFDLDRGLRLLGERIARAPMREKTPPADLLANVMSSVSPKQPSLWRRIMRWLSTPMDFSLAPMRLIPAGAALAALFLTLAVFPMQQNNTGAPGLVAANEKAAVDFTLSMPRAETVALVGNFNQWTPDGYEMRWDDKKERWVLSIPLPPGRYQYGYLVDGQRLIPDPDAFINQDDGFGNTNSIMIIDKAGSHEHLI